MLIYLGASTSSHQIEGNTHNDWTRWELANADNLAKEFPSKFNWLPKNIYNRIKKQATNPKNYISDNIIDHYHKYKQDLQLLKKLNLNSYRFSIEWARIEPKRGKYNKTGINFYKNIILELKELNITPFITLWHFTNPTWVTDSGWLFNKKNQKAFINYAIKIITELKTANPEIKFIMTFNEPIVYANQNFLQGNWVLKKNFWNFIRAIWVFRKLHIAVYKKLKNIYPDLQISYAKNISLFEPANKNIINKALAQLAMYFTSYLFINSTKKYIDWLGINYYFYNLIDFNLVNMQGIRALIKHRRIYFINNKNDKVSDLGWWLKPEKIKDLLIKVWRRYKIPLIITENGLADAQDKYRKWFIKETMQCIQKAKEAGVNVVGYFHWSLLDNFEWDKGYWPQFGLVKVDFKTGKRKIRESAYWLHKHASSIML